MARIFYGRIEFVDCPFNDFRDTPGVKRLDKDFRLIDWFS